MRWSLSGGKLGSGHLVERMCTWIDPKRPPREVPKRQRRTLVELTADTRRVGL